MLTFELTDDQTSKIDKWWNKHIRICKLGYDNGMRYIFDHSNGIGWVERAECKGCNEIKDVTDPSLW